MDNKGRDIHVIFVQKLALIAALAKSLEPVLAYILYAV